ncbi:MAG: hypothetical protein WAK17_20440 [Candidatus Nitrosopolaris sp.]
MARGGGCGFGCGHYGSWGNGCEGCGNGGLGLGNYGGGCGGTCDNDGGRYINQ